MSQSHRERLEAASRGIEEAKRDYEWLRFAKKTTTKPGPPAGPAELAAVEKEFGGPLPPSFREFLLLHGSWTDFEGDAGILTMAQRSDPHIREQIGGFRGLADPAAAKGWVIIAGPSTHYLVYLDPATKRPDGEMDVVEWSYEEGPFERHADFVAYLEGQCAVLQAMVAKEKGSGGAKP